MRQEVMFTACPRGRTGDGLELSVFIAPRLDPQDDGHVLATFPDFLDWPSVVSSIAWQVSVAGTVHEAQVASDPPEPALWTALFNDQTLVRPPEFPDYAQHLWLSYPAGNLAGFVESLYQNIAVNFPTQFPQVSDLLNTDIPGMAHLDPEGQDNRHVLRRRLENELRDGNARALPPGPLDVEFDSFQLWNFHQPGNLALGVEQPEFDFHEVVGFCSEQFGLLRRLGLVVDLTVPATPQPGGVSVQVLPEFDSATPNHVAVLPITECVIGADSFVAANRTPAEIVDGQLPLDKPDYRLVQVDVDGAVLNLITLARNLHQAASHTSLDTPDHEAVPALRSGGLAVVHAGMAQQLVRHVDVGGELNAAREADAEIELFAEDIWRGTRFDVIDGVTGLWRSLQKREGSYEFLSALLTEQISEEAAIIETPSSRDEDDPAADDQFLYQGESLTRWDGWSLAAPRPGRTLLNQDQVGDAPNDPPEEFPLAMSFAATPASLPRLRFGVRYRMRARAVDLAGNSLAPETTDTSHATAPAPYLRYEPVQAPFVLPRHPRQEGDSVEHVVLRSNFDTDPEQNAERHIAPPRTAQRTAEEHGRYDTDTGLDPAVYAEIVAREAQSFADPSYGGGISENDPNAYDQPRFPDVPLPLLYLPDPLARGVSFHRESDDEVLVSFEHGDGWPSALPVRLVVEEGDGLLEIIEADQERIVRVGLPKAETLRVPYSCYVDDEALDVSAIWALMESAPGVTDDDLKQWRDFAHRGRLWMLTPSRTMTLVHAVRQPLKTPEFVNPGITRQSGSTLAQLIGGMTFSRKSTSRVDVRARWTDPVDRGAGGGAAAPDPFDQDHEQWLEVPLVPPDTGGSGEDSNPLGVRHEFGDTKHHVVTYRLFATSAFSEYFEEGPFTRHSIEDAVLDVPSSARPPAPKVLYVIPTHRWSSGGGGLSLSSIGEGGGLRVYLDRPFFQSGVGELLGVVLAPSPSNIPDTLAPYVTRWGFDPIRAATDLPGAAPQPQHFPLAAEDGVGTDRILDENDLLVDVAGHDVGYDAERDLWYCDIEVDSGEAEWPFIRLALASYQPSSVGDLHLSRVVLADIVQLTPDRSATIGLASPGSRDVQVSFVAPLPPREGPGTSVTARLERHLPDVEDEILGWEQVSGANTEIELRPVADLRGSTAWNGSLPLPPRSRPGHDELRIVIEEWQLLRHNPERSRRSRRSSDDIERRLVFHDIVDVSPLISR
jgi:hypothetical protein